MIQPPENSKIRIETENGFDKIVLPPPSGGSHFFITRLLLPAIIFLVLYAGVIGPLRLILGTDMVLKDPLAAVGIIIALLFSIALILFLFWSVKAFSGRFPETLLLSKPNLIYDSGTCPPTLSYQTGLEHIGDVNRPHRKAHEFMWRGRLQTEFTPAQIATLKLKPEGSMGCLTISRGVNAVELAVNATRSEREWLFSTIGDFYGVEAVIHSAPLPALPVNPRPASVTIFCLIFWFAGLIHLGFHFGWLGDGPQHIPEGGSNGLELAHIALVAIAGIGLWALKKWGLLLTWGIGAVALSAVAFSLVPESAKPPFVVEAALVAIHLAAFIKFLRAGRFS